MFIVGRFGDLCPPEILFEQEGGFRDDKTQPEMGERGLCISTRDGERNDPTNETLVAQCLSAHDFAGDVVAEGRKRNIIASTIGSTPRGDTSFVWQDTYIAQTNTNRKRKVAGAPGKLDSRRGIIIGNGVTVTVAEWIGKRIIAVQLAYLKSFKKGFALKD